MVICTIEKHARAQLTNFVVTDRGLACRTSEQCWLKEDENMGCDLVSKLE